MGLQAVHIHINGIVQGVGFRPFIYNLAQRHDLKGWVRNSASGVDIEVLGPIETIQEFIKEITDLAPPLSQIDNIDFREIAPEVFNDFKIIHSKNLPSDFIPVSPDTATCQQCLDELFDPNDRRFHYPFINCTNCGPRFTIIKDIPYDRPKTTMANFEMCEKCKQEYENPRDRRFHAQPVACPNCGPQIWLEDSQGQQLAVKDQAMLMARRFLADGKILAVKGLGGFHLACDATNPQAVDTLRNRKRRSGKPFALMAPNLDIIKQYVEVSETAEKLLKSPQAPIVLMPKIKNRNIADSVAPNQANLGIMLAYTPLHHLLLQEEEGYPPILVMTSGNLSEEPIIHENQNARDKLSEIADAFLMHDRPIHMRIDDSVYGDVQEKPYPIRRARGFAPNPIRVNHSLPQILAVGPQMKNTFCLTRDKYAFLSHYIGEMENYETYQDYRKAIQHYENLFRITPEVIAYDLHPDYLSTRYALERESLDNLPSHGVQHHHAHLAAAMIENDVDPDCAVAGLIFDGTGYGTDGTIWGGEVLLGNCNSFERILHLKPVPLPGGEASIRKPARMALSTLWAYDLPWKENLAPVRVLSSDERNSLIRQLENRINCPMTSSMGRLFDAVSALLGVRETITYEAQAAIELEAIANRDETSYYPWGINNDQINVNATLHAILDDLSKNIPVSTISARFHNTLAQLSLQIALKIKEIHGINQVVLSGGVWQNLTLLRKTLTLFAENQIQSIIHHQMPPNDGCVAFGQAMIAAYWYQNHKE
jgi:hydrogenase maturation protein HypF